MQVEGRQGRSTRLQAHPMSGVSMRHAQRSVERGQWRVHWLKRALAEKKWGVHGAPRRRRNMTCLEAQGMARMAPGGRPRAVLA